MSPSTRCPSDCAIETLQYRVNNQQKSRKPNVKRYIVKTDIDFLQFVKNSAGQELVCVLIYIYIYIIHTMDWRRKLRTSNSRNMPY